LYLRKNHRFILGADNVLKILGSIMVIASSGIIGFLYSSFYYMRVKQLRNLEFALNLLEAEIVFSKAPLREAFSNVTSRCISPIKELFQEFETQLALNSRQELRTILSVSLAKFKSKLYLADEELEVLAAFFNGLGSTDLEGQKKNFNITMKKLQSIGQKAEENRQKNEKLFRYLGVCCGMLIVIILI
jgi:stage III sporulation protein AB